jgi:hypothetical protein
MKYKQIAVIEHIFEEKMDEEKIRSPGKVCR